MIFVIRMANLIIEFTLTATAAGLACSMRITLEAEQANVKAKVKIPTTYMIPAFIGVGYAGRS